MIRRITYQGKWTGLEIRDDEDEEEDDDSHTRASLMFPLPDDDGTAPYLLVLIGEEEDDGAGPDERTIVLDLVDLVELHRELGAWIKEETAKHEAR